MKKLAFALAAAAVCVLSGPVAAESIGIFDQHSDIGSVAFAGKVTLDKGAYRMTASGANIWGTTDAFHFAAKPMSGDVSLAANISFEGQGTDPHRKAGVMLRQNTAPDSPYVDIMVHGSGLVSLQYRETPGSETRQIVANVPGVTRVQLDYQNGYAWMSLAGADGVMHPAGGGFPLHFDGPYLAGLALSAHNNTVTETATFSKVALTQLPTMATPTPQTKVESTLEILTISNRERDVVYHTADHIEAPNWSHDGSYLLFNGDGRLFTLPTTGGTPKVFDTGGLNRMNNDHGFSADGQWLAVSDQTNADHQSRVYVLPATGGEGRQITEQAPSYWHGWSPDGKTLAVIANRNGDYDVYAIPSVGGEEVRLTTTPGLDDGSDYSPDGQWIYFNSVRSGNMKIWRMHPDGSGAEQLTFGDDTRDWFAHPSPDGQWIAFVSFGTDVAVGDHPANKNVMLRLMPAAGGEPVVVARLFGGQGTMNVPSWSPDSKRLAFVSYRPVGQ